MNLNSAKIPRIRQGAALVLVSIAAAGELQAQAQQSIFAVGKAGQYVQTAPGMPAVDPTAAYVATAAAPSSGSFVAPNGVTRGLTYMATGGTVFANNGDYEFDQYFTSAAQLDSSFPSGNYQFLRPGQSTVTLSLSGDLYPPVPQVVVATWNPSGQLVLDPSIANEIQFNVFPGYATLGVVGQVELTVQGPDGNNLIDATFISSQQPQAPTSVPVAAGTLTAGQTYKAMLVFGTYVVADGASVPGSILLSTYANETSFTILAQGASSGTLPAAKAQPVSRSVAIGSTAVLSFGVSGSPAPTFQWFLNGTALPFATSSTLVVAASVPANAGTYTCVATNPSGAVTSHPATLAVVSTADPGRLINLSTRAQVGTGANILILGFAVGGTGSLPVLARASGPALGPFNVTGTLPDPQLQLFTSASAVIATNDGWAGDPTISAEASAVGAFAWANPTSHDSALATSVAQGAYTAQVSGQSGDSGVALAEVYDATPPGAYTTGSPGLVNPSPRLVNLSARVMVGTGSNIMIAGFVIGGTTAKTVLIRASGPALVPYGVAGTLSDPALQVFDSNSTVVAANTAWGGDLQIASTADSVGAFTWPSPTSKDSALLVTLAPGAYTAEVSGAAGDTGVALVEVYEVP